MIQQFVFSNLPQLLKTLKQKIHLFRSFSMKTGGERLPSIRRTLTIFAMPVSPARILEDLSPFYRQEEFPVLLHQCETWAESRPLEGCRVIDASPVFRNTGEASITRHPSNGRLSAHVSHWCRSTGNSSCRQKGDKSSRMRAGDTGMAKIVRVLRMEGNLSPPVFIEKLRKRCIFCLRVFRSCGKFEKTNY